MLLVSAGAGRRPEAFQLLSGPTSAAFAVQVYTSGKLQKNIDPPIWMIVICAGSLVVGLATYGYNVTRAMGVRLAKLSPVRGFVAELATAMIITVAAQVGL
jgi:sodium-dependent phosphate transporter